MKKTLLLLAFAATLVGHADYLYWMVDNSSISGKDIQGGDATFDWTTAILKAEEDTQIMTLSRSDAATYEAMDGYAVANISSYPSGTFFIELYNGDKWLAQSEHKAASALSQYIFSSNSMANIPAAGFGQAGTTTYAVPEPTSGLLFLIGGMLLGLNRRRQQV